MSEASDDRAHFYAEQAEEHEPVFHYMRDHAVCLICWKPIRWLSYPSRWVHVRKAS